MQKLENVVSVFANPPDHVLRALVVLSRDQNFEAYVSYLQDCMYQEALNASFLPDDVHSRWANGRVQCLNILLSHIKNAKEMISNLMNAEHEEKKAGVF